MLAEGFSYIALSILSTVPSSSTFSRIFIIKLCKILSDFFCLYWHNDMNLCYVHSCGLLHLLNCICLTTLNLREKVNLSWCIIFLMHVCIFSKYFFTINLSELFIGLLFSFLLWLYLYCVLECYCLHGRSLGVLAPTSAPPPLTFLLLLLLHLVYYY